MIASLVDGVLMALKPTSDSRLRAERAKETLETIDVQPLGVVVNGIGGASARAYKDNLSVYDQAYPESAGKPANQPV